MFFCLTGLGLLSGFVFQSEWKYYLYAEAGFRIRFPVAPKVAQEQNATVAQIQFQGITYQVAAQYGQRFDLNLAEKLLEESEAGFVDPGQDNIVSRRDNFKVKNYPAKEIRIRTQDGLFIIFRAIITPKCTYQFVVSRNGAFAEAALVTQFFDSFAMLAP
ncbi:MAG: hypothetical protein HC913_18895 [Microscillaceae bacterium]|nr:hypothetical protein [Microscillaceae bacterium]